MPAAHPLQLVDGASATLKVGTLSLGSRVTATKNSGTGILTFTGEPTLTTALGVTSFNLSIDKQMQTYSLLNDDGWSQSHTTVRSYTADLEMYYTKATATGNTLEGAFEILHNASLGDEVEIYWKLFTYLGVAGANKRYEVKAGNASAKLQQRVPADNMISISLSLSGQGPFIQGYQELVSI